VHTVRHGKMLNHLEEVYTGLRLELEQHLAKEEQILFPLISQLDAYAAHGGALPQTHGGTIVNPISRLEHEHDGAGEALQKMRSLTEDYTLPEDACPSFVALYEGLKAMEATSIGTSIWKTTSCSPRRWSWKRRSTARPRNTSRSSRREEARGPET